VAADPNLVAMFPGPIEVYVEELAASHDLPAVAIGACLVRQHEAGPLLRQLVTRASDDGIATDSQAAQLFRALHILGGARDAAAFLPLLRFLRGQQDEVDYLLGDASTETLPKIAAGVFDGNADALFEAILDRNVDGAIRGSLVSAAAFLTWEQRIDRPRMITFLEQFAREPSVPGDDLAWYAWAVAIALLGLRHLEPLVSEAEQNERLDELLFLREDFEAILATAEQAPDDKTRFDDANLGYIEDVLAALELFPYGYDDEGDDDSRGFDEGPTPQPVTNPWRHVGRNDPCPCGSGKKAKRCCLAA
jgi:hypothetical protein